MKEEWRDIKGYEGLYQISNLGRVKSLARDTNNQYCKVDKIIKANPNKWGYLNVNLYKKGKGKPFKVHRLVALHFIENPENLPEVNHKDENKSNNCVDNLEWCTSKDNCNHGTRNKRISEKLKDMEFTEEHKKKLSQNHADFKGSKNPFHGKNHTDECKKIISEKCRGKNEGSKHYRARKVQCITTGKKFSTITEASEYYYIDRHYITNNCKDSNKYGGKHPITEELLVWKYIEEVL